jgi:hypothetical protein
MIGVASQACDDGESVHVARNDESNRTWEEVSEAICSRE